MHSLALNFSPILAYLSRAQLLHEITRSFGPVHNQVDTIRSSCVVYHVREPVVEFEHLALAELDLDDAFLLCAYKELDLTNTRRISYTRLVHGTGVSIKHSPSNMVTPHP